MWLGGIEDQAHQVKSCARMQEAGPGVIIRTNALN